MANPQSTAQIAGHPIHPMLIPFPVAFFVSGFFCDLIFWQTGNTMWTAAALWLIGAGIIMALIAALAGFTDFLNEPRIRALDDAWWHMGGNLVLVVLQIVNWYGRYTSAENFVLPWGLILSLIAVGLLLFNGWKGWEMVYRHRVGIAEESTRTPQP